MNETITVKELKEFLKDWPEIDEYGDPYEVWIETGWCLSSPAVELTQLNRGDIFIGAGTTQKSTDEDQTKHIN